MRFSRKIVMDITGPDNSETSPSIGHGNQNCDKIPMSKGSDKIEELMTAG